MAATPRGGTTSYSYLFLNSDFFSLCVFSVFVPFFCVCVCVCVCFFSCFLLRCRPRTCQRLQASSTRATKARKLAKPLQFAQTKGENDSPAVVFSYSTPGRPRRCIRGQGRKNKTVQQKQKQIGANRKTH